MVCTEGPARVRELIAMGASFDHGEDGKLHLAREGGHSHHRIVHAADMTGREIERALLKAVVNDPKIFMFEHHFAIDLLTSQVCFPTSFEPTQCKIMAGLAFCMLNMDTIPLNETIFISNSAFRM